MAAKAVDANKRIDGGLSPCWYIRPPAAGRQAREAGATRSCKSAAHSDSE